jgi:ABC-type multidrug transport system permease subunit
METKKETPEHLYSQMKKREKQFDVAMCFIVPYMLIGILTGGYIGAVVNAANEYGTIPAILWAIFGAPFWYILFKVK